MTLFRSQSLFSNHNEMQPPSGISLRKPSVRELPPCSWSSSPRCSWWSWNEGSRHLVVPDDLLFLHVSVTNYAQCRPSSHPPNLFFWHLLCCFSLFFSSAPAFALSRFRLFSRLLIRLHPPVTIFHTVFPVRVHLFKTPPPLCQLPLRVHLF